MLGGFGPACASIYVVDTVGDPGPAGSTSLREAIAAASASDGNIVKFDADLVGSTITLQQGQIQVFVHHDFAIEGRGSRALAISGGDQSQIFVFSQLAVFAEPRHKITISGLTLEHGRYTALPPGGFNASPNFAGGALYSKYADIALNDIVITGCHSDHAGGAIQLLYTASLTMHDGRIVDNHAGTNGGGIGVMHGGNVYLYDSTISGNTAYRKGGGIYVDEGNIFRVNRSLIANNTINAPRDGNDVQAGGGIALLAVAQETTITNSTISGNFTYAAGGGISLMDATTSDHTKIWFSTIADNYGGYRESSSGMHSTGAVKLNSTIIAGNSNRGDTFDLDGTVSASHSLIGNAQGAVVTGSANLIGVDPQLGPLKDNGGPTLTKMPAAAGPAIGTADGGTGIVVDQRGQPRTTGPFSAGNDIGAVERQLVEDLIFRNNFEFY
ncbi:MAG TPA: choice-of-anchor Q domain-containing protein [Rudaea sp.]